MVKKKVGGAQRFRTALKAVQHGGPVQGQQRQQQSGPAPPQHLQRKIKRTAKFVEKVAATKAALQMKPQIKKKRKQKPLASLSGLAGTLDELVAQQQTNQPGRQAAQQAQRGRGSSIKRVKARSIVTVKETVRLQQVLQHPAYKADPIAAITNHINATMPPVPIPAAARTQKRGGKNERKKSCRV